ncbi:MAG: hypothetical protein Q7S36_00555 [Candidatus Liptonbacteria bacterium]|nr:hypothetical protein [Candidatus Liptonbacteria bacterium]
MLKKLGRSLREYWEKQKEYGRQLDAKFAPPRKPEYICLYLGCVETRKWVYLDDGRELPGFEPEWRAFFSKGNWRDILYFLMHPVRCLADDAENARVANSVVMGACDKHRRENCIWTREFVREKVAEAKEAKNKR